MGKMYGKSGKAIVIPAQAGIHLTMDPGLRRGDENHRYNRYNRVQGELFLLTAICLVFLLTGCGTPPEMMEEKVVSVQRAEVTHTIMYDPGVVALSSDELGAVQHMLKDVRPMGLHGVTIEGDTYTRTDRRRMKNLGALLVRHDVPHNKIHTSHAIIGQDEVRLNVAHMVAIPPRNCPDWSKYSATNFYNTPHSNVGCATKTNLAVQVADPGDLLHGRGDMQPDNARSSVAIGRYRRIEPYGGAEQQQDSVGD